MFPFVSFLFFLLVSSFALSIEENCLPEISFFSPRRFFFQPDLLEQRVEVFCKSDKSHSDWIVDFHVSYPSKDFVYQNSFRTKSQWFLRAEKIHSKFIFVLKTRSLSQQVQQIPILHVTCFSTQKNHQNFSKNSPHDWIKCSPFNPLLFWVPLVLAFLSGVGLICFFQYKRWKRRKIINFLQKIFLPLSNLLQLGLPLDHPFSALVAKELWHDALFGLQNFFRGSIAQDASFWLSVSTDLSPTLPQKVLHLASKKQFSHIVNLLAKFRKNFSGKNTNGILSENSK